MDPTPYDLNPNAVAARPALTGEGLLREIVVRMGYSDTNVTKENAFVVGRGVLGATFGSPPLLCSMHISRSSLQGAPLTPPLAAVAG